jgi:hypothetical protein
LTTGLSPSRRLQKQEGLQERSDAAVRRFGAYSIAQNEQKGESDNLLGHPTYLEGKLKGESSMLGTQLNMKVWNVMRC